MPKKPFLKFLVFIFSAFVMVGCNGSKDLTTSPQVASLLYNPRRNVIAGNPNGDVTLVEFFDYQCPYCRKMIPVIQQLIQKDPNLRVVFKEYLLFGPSSEPATRAALAANKQGKYLSMHNALMQATQPLESTEIMRIAKNNHLNTAELARDMTAPDINQQIQENNNLADEIGANGAPVFVITNSSIAKNPQNTQNRQIFLMGASSVEKLQKLIAKVRQ